MLIYARRTRSSSSASSASRCATSASPALYISTSTTATATAPHPRRVRGVRARPAPGGRQRLHAGEQHKYPDRYTCVGGCGLTAPEDDMVTFVAQNHSLSMWAYAKNNDDSYSDDT